MTATQHIVGDADRFHRAALRAREQQRDATLYACEQLHAAGTEPTGPEVRQWLEQHGRRVGRTTVWKAVTEYRSEHGLPDLDDDRGLFDAGGVNTEYDSEQTTEQPSGATNVFTIEQIEPGTDLASETADHAQTRGSGEQGDEPTDQRHRATVNVALTAGERSPATMAGSAHMGSTGDMSDGKQTPAAAQRGLADHLESWKRARQAKRGRGLPTWPVLVMAFPAFVAIWSGWVGLGELTGFGVVHPLPGIWDDLTINSAITLPIGVEAYASYALYVWLSGRIETQTTRTYAMVSAFASLAIGAAGQIAFHIMEARHITAAPWWIITLVACLPVAVVGMGAVLAHLIIRERHTENN